MVRAHIVPTPSSAYALDCPFIKLLAWNPAESFRSSTWVFNVYITYAFALYLTDNYLLSRSSGICDDYVTMRPWSCAYSHFQTCMSFFIFPMIGSHPLFIVLQPPQKIQKQVLPWPFELCTSRLESLVLRYIWLNHSVLKASKLLYSYSSKWIKSIAFWNNRVIVKCKAKVISKEN